MAKPIQRSCRSCVYWDKPAGQKAIAGKYHPCTAPLPAVVNLPDSVTAVWGMRQMIREQRAQMERDEGKNCPTWAELGRKP